MLATYNGEKYIKEQLDSLYAQKGVEIYLLVRDDGSKDSTLTILDEYKNNFGCMTILRGKNLGSAKCFFALIDYAVDNLSDYDYYAFCDQDDIWLDNKLLVSVDSLEKSTSQYKCFIAKQQLVDSDLNPLPSSSIIKTNRNLASALISSHAAGCTMVVTLDLLRMAVRYCNCLHNNDTVVLHDAIINRIAWMMNAYIQHSDQPLMYYRQHENNVVGAESSSLNIIKNRIKRLISSKDNTKSRIAANLIESFTDDIPENNRSILLKCAEYRKSFFKRLRLLFSKEMYQQGILDSVGTFIMIASGKF